MLNIKANKRYFDLFLKKNLENVKLINEKRGNNKGIKTIFTIGSDVVSDNGSLPYVTPVRFSKYHFIAGCIVFNEIQAILIAELLDGLIDIIAVDAEKKVPITSIANKRFLSKDILDLLDGSNKTVGLVDSGNLSDICCEIIKKSSFFEFKANDLTVDAAWAFISNKLKSLSRKKIAIIGAGNIGTKLALKFVESGANVTINRRNSYIGNTVSNAINLIKPELTIASVGYTESIIKSCFMSDVIIGTSHANSVITWEHIAVSKKDSIIVDVGKGSIEKDAIKKAFTCGKDIYRIDVTSALEGHLLTLVRNDEIIKNTLGRKLMDGFGLVSGGMLGLEGDIVVDSINNPKVIIGIANGKGDLLKKYDKRSLNRLRILKKKFNLRDNIVI